MKQAPLILNDEFKYALDRMEKSSDTLFITGRAGTGKSTLLQLFTSTTKKNVVVLAPTGIAALNVQGQTIHSFFRFAPRWSDPSAVYKLKNHHVYLKIDTIIIDEISMVRVDMLDRIDNFLRVNRGNQEEAFGGVQMIFFGDLFQLPPVIGTQEEKQILEANYESPYFFNAFVMEELQLEMIALNKVYRQEERHFIKLLDAIRLKQLDYDDFMELNERANIQFEEDDIFISLCSTNAAAEAINRKNMQAIMAPEERFLSELTGVFDIKRAPAPQVLLLKEGAQVMFVKNDPEKRFVNGTLGKVITATKDLIRVVIQSDRLDEVIIDVEPLSWDMIKYEWDESQKSVKAKVTGSFTQYPLKLAWAITIHKSQGKTFDKVFVDLGRGAFEYGQTYVALSRCRTFEGIVLAKPLKSSDIMADERIIDYYQGLR